MKNKKYSNAKDILRRFAGESLRDLRNRGWHLRYQATCMAKRAARGTRQHKLLVFISDFPITREAKLAYGLRSIGWRVVLLHRRAPLFNPSEYFDEAQVYQEPRDALAKAVQYNPVAYHVFSQLNYNTAATLVRYRPGKIVLDSFDLIAGMFNDRFLSQRRDLYDHIPVERYCLENADGLCCRNLETQHVKQALGYRFRGKRIFFPEYCWGLAYNGKKLSDVDGELHLVYGGSFNVEKSAGSEEQSGDHELLWLAKLLACHKVHFHVYWKYRHQYVDFEDRFSPLIVFQESEEYLHFHKPVPTEKWVPEISQYDAGIMIWPPLIYDKEFSTYTPYKPILTYGTKLADYIDAGLHFLSHRGILIFWLANRLGVATPVDRDALESDTFWAQMPNKIQQSRKMLPTASKQWSIEKNAKRLADFYLSL